MLDASKDTSFIDMGRILCRYANNGCSVTFDTKSRPTGHIGRCPFRYSCDLLSLENEDGRSIRLRRSMQENHSRKRPRRRPPTLGGQGAVHAIDEPNVYTAAISAREDAPEKALECEDSQILFDSVCGEECTLHRSLQTDTDSESDEELIPEKAVSRDVAEALAILLISLQGSKLSESSTNRILKLVTTPSENRVSKLIFVPGNGSLIPCRNKYCTEGVKSG